MDQLDILAGYFTIGIGTIFILLGFNVLKWSKDEEAQKKYHKLKNFYRFGGIAFILYGLMKVL